MLLSCGSPAPTTPSAADASRRVQTQEFEQKPNLVSIERLGDPHGSLAVAIQHDGDSAGGTAFADAVVGALTQSQMDADAVVFERGLLVRVRLTARNSSRALKHLRDALLTQMNASRGSQPVTVDACGQRGKPRTARQIQAALGWNNIALAAVGSPKLLAAVQSAHESAGEWPSGVVPATEWPAKDQIFVSKSEGMGHLILGLRSAAVGRVGTAAESLLSGESEFRAIAQNAPGSWKVATSSSSVLAAGGCVTLSLESRAPTTSASAGRLANSLLEEMERAVALAPEQPIELYALKATDPVDAAGRAAWLSLHRGSEKPSIRVVHYDGRNARAKAFQKAFVASPRAIPTRSKRERGQGRLWALLTRACPAEAEDAASAGFTAAALLAAAQTIPGVDPWISERGLGLIASEPSFGAEAPKQLAARLARALLSVTSEQGETTIAREKMTDLLPASPQWDLALRLVSDGDPSSVYPPGLSRSVATINTERAAKTLRAFLSGPLQLVMLTTEGSAQAGETRSRLETLLAPARGQAPAPSCAPRSSPPASALAGQYAVDSTDSSAILSWPVDPESLPMARWFAQFLNTFWLKRGLLEPGLVQSSVAQALGELGGTGALVLTLRADAEKLDPAIAQARALIARLRLRGPTPVEFSQLQKRRGNGRASVDPRKRLIGLWLKDPPILTRRQIQEFATTHLGENRLFLVRPRSN